MLLARHDVTPQADEARHLQERNAARQGHAPFWRHLRTCLPSSIVAPCAHFSGPALFVGALTQKEKKSVP